VKQRRSYSLPSAYCFTQIEAPSSDRCARLDALERRPLSVTLLH